MQFQFEENFDLILFNRETRLFGFYKLPWTNLIIMFWNRWQPCQTTRLNFKMASRLPTSRILRNQSDIFDRRSMYVVFLAHYVHIIWQHSYISIYCLIRYIAVDWCKAIQSASFSTHPITWSHFKNPWNHPSLAWFDAHSISWEVVLEFVCAFFENKT